jgi:uncharacterized protein (DUF1501 family)
MKSTRRLFLKQGAIALASVGLAPAFGPKFLRSAVYADAPVRLAAGTGGKKIMICIFQRGAVDGMSMVVPHGDSNYYQLRQVGPGGIAIPNTGPDSLLDLDGFYGLHPSLAPLKPIFDAGHLAPIQAVGSPNPTRSHFDAQDFMESAAPGMKIVQDGWLARTLNNCPEDQANMKALFRGVSMTSRVPRSLEGYAHALAIPDLKTFGLAQSNKVHDLNPDGTPGNAAPSDMSASGAFEAMYDQGSGDVIHGAGKETFDALKVVKSIDAKPYTPANGAVYPRGSFGTSLMQIAQLIKSDVGVEIAFAEIGGWDTHVAQGSTTGRLATDLKDFGSGLAALYADLGDKMSDVVVLTMSEFGRTARQNGNGGTDHGHATCFFAMGGDVKGGKVLGQWPGLAPEQLNENRDLAVTTDFRDVFGELAQRHLGLTDLSALFPDYQTGADKYRNILSV